MHCVLDSCIVWVFYVVECHLILTTTLWHKNTMPCTGPDSVPPQFMGFPDLYNGTLCGNSVVAQTHTHREEGQVKTEAETGGMGPRAKDSQELPEARGCSEGSVEQILIPGRKGSC